MPLLFINKSTLICMSLIFKYSRTFSPNAEAFRKVSIKKLSNKLVHLKLTHFELPPTVIITESFVLLVILSVCAFTTSFERATPLRENCMLMKREVCSFSFYLTIGMVPCGKTGCWMLFWALVNTLALLPRLIKIDACHILHVSTGSKIKCRFLSLILCSSSHLYTSYCFCMCVSFGRRHITLLSKRSPFSSMTVSLFLPLNSLSALCFVVVYSTH